jgi:integrase
MDATGYYSYRNPKSKRTKGLGRDKAHAFSEARAANQALADLNPSNLAQWVLGIEVMSLTAWMPIYRELWIKKQEPAGSTIIAADRYMARFAKLDFAHMPMSQITTVHIATYLDGVAEKAGAGAALNIRARLMDIFAFAITKGHVETGKNPVDATQPAKYAPKRDRLSIEQFKQLRALASPALVNAMNLAILTGQRVSDIVAMKFEDVKDGYLHVAQIKSGGSMKIKLDLNVGLGAVEMTIGDAVKLCRDRVVSKHLIHAVKTVGPSRAGSQLNASSISNAFSALRGESGIVGASGKTPPTFHEIRSLSERLYRQEYDGKFAQSILGHKTETMTEKYDDLRGSDWLTVSIKAK